MDDGPGPIDVLIIILSPVIVAVLTAVFLVKWWVEAVWRRGAAALNQGYDHGE